MSLPFGAVSQQRSATLPGLAVRVHARIRDEGARELNGRMDSPARVRCQADPGPDRRSCRSAEALAIPWAARIMGKPGSTPTSAGSMASYVGHIHKMLNRNVPVQPSPERHRYPVPGFPCAGAVGCFTPATEPDL